MNCYSIHSGGRVASVLKRTLLLSLLLTTTTLPSFAQDWEIEFKSGDAFIENKGQYDGRDLKPGSEILYGIDQNPIYVFFTKKGLSYRFDRIEKHKSPGDEKSHRRVVGELHHMEWVGSNPNVQVIADQERPDGYSFSRYIDAQHSATIEYHPKAFEKITYVNLYPNIDVEYVIHPEGGFKYSVILHPGADPSLVRMKYGNGSVLSLGSDGQLQLRGERGEMDEKAPYTYDEDESDINSKFVLNGQEVSFELGSYDNSKLVVIDPWVISPTFSTSNAVWEVEHDAAGNVYAIGGESPMLLKKFSPAGALIWTHTTPWDTNSHWLGTMATDDAGNTYVTAGTNAEIRKVTTANATVWTQNHGTAGGLSTEFWSITFNCDQTKLTVGGTQGSIPPMGSIHEIETVGGSHLGNTQVSSGSSLFSPVEVRGVASSDNARYYYISHNSVGAISDNLNLNCGNGNGLFFDTPHTYSLAYKCEDYLPATQNGGGLKAIAANGQYFYTHRGDQVDQRSLADGSVINTAPIPGGVSNTVFGGGRVVENCGIDVDAAGNVYVGSKNQVVKYDANLNQLATAPVNMTVYDVDVNANNEIVACGAQADNGSANRNGRIQAVNMSSAGTFPLICCDANVCPAGPFCDNDAPFDLIESTAGGTWSGNGVNAVTGVFDPVAAGIGSHWIVYTLPCGSDSIEITVLNCAPMDVCVEANGDLTVSGGSGTYTWQEEQVISSGCVNGLGNCAGIFSFTDPAPPTATWVDFSTNATINPSTDPTTTPPPATPWQVVDGNGTIFTIADVSALPSCGSCTPPTLAETHVDETCPGASDGSIDLTVTGSSTYNFSWSPGAATTEDLTGLAAGSYTVTVTDQADASCTATLSVTVGVGTSPTFAIDGSSNPTTCGGSDGTITLAALNASTTYDLYYDDDGVTVGPISITTDAGGGYVISGLDAGSYTNFVVDLGGCTGNQPGPVTLVDPAAPTFTLSSTDPTTCGGTDGTITLTGLTASTSYMVSFDDDGVGQGPTSMTSDASGNIVITGLDAGNYTNFVVDLAGCTGTQAGPITLVDPSAPTFTLSSTDPTTCGGTDGTITLTGLTASTSYMVSYDDDGVGQGPTSMTSDASGNIVITGLNAGSYTNFVVDLAGCTGSQPGPITLVDPSAPTFTLSSTDPTTCGGTDGTITLSGLTASTSYMVSYDDDGVGQGPTSMTADASGNIVITGLDAGSYTNFVADLGGCVGTQPGPITLVSASPPAITTSGTNPSGCGVSDGSVSISGLNANTSYTLSYDTAGVTVTASFTSDASGVITITGLPSQTYANIIADDGTCASTGNAVTLNDPGAPVVTAGPDLTVCEGSSVTLNAVPSSGTVSWDNGVTNNVSFVPAVGVTTYTVTANDAGCIATDQMILTVNPLPTYTVTPTDATCGNPDGMLTLSGLTPNTSYDVTYQDAGGTQGPTSYTTDASGDIVISNLPAGSYFGFVVSDGTCQGNLAGPFAISTTAAASFTVTSPVDPSSCGMSDGSITLSGLTAGTAYNISYDDDGVTQGPASMTADASGNIVLTGLDAGAYTNFTVEIGGCPSTDPGPVNLVDPAPAAITLASTDPTTCLGTDGTITLSGLAPNTSYSVSYDDATGTVGPNNMTSDAAGDIVITGLSAGSYSNFAADNGMCVSTNAGPVTLSDPASPAFTLSSSNPTACGLADGSITLSGLNASTAYNVVYTDASGIQGPTSMTSDAAGDIVINGLTAGSYSDFAVELGGCVGTDPGPITLSDPGAPIVDAGTDQIVCEGDMVTLTANASSGTISWDNGVTDGVAFTPAVGATTYTVTADDAGCISTDQVTVTVTASPSFTLSYTDPSGCATSDGSITISGLQANTAYDLSYDTTSTVGPTAITSDASGQIVLTGLPSGTFSNFTLVLNGCSTTDPSVLNLVGPTNASAQFTTADTVIICQGDSALLSVDLQGGAPWTLDYSIDGVPQATVNVSSSPYSFYTQTGGTYTLTGVTENGGCAGTILGTNVFVYSVPRPPAPTISGAGTYCDGLNVPHLIATGTGGNIQWFYDSSLTQFAADGDTLYNVFYDTPGVFDFWAVENFYGCPGDSTPVTVTILDPGYMDIPDTIHLCLGDVVTISPNSSDTVYWDVLGGSVFGDITISPQLDTVMMAWMNTECGPVSQGVWVFVHPLPNVIAGPDQTIALHEQAQLNAMSSSNVVWSPAISLTCSTCLDPLAAPTVTTEYVVTAVSDYNCIATDTVLVIVEGEWELYVPNVFSPNDDGWNDDVHVQGPPLEEYSITIFNRWGEKMFESNDISQRWDGTWRNKPAGQGVYVYIVRATISTTNTVVEQSGNITLLR